MKILLVNTFLRGGASVACIRLHQGLLQFGESSTLLVANTQGLSVTETYQYQKIYQPPSISQKITSKLQTLSKRLKKGTTKKVSAEKAFLAQRDPQLEYFSFPQSNMDITQNPWYADADIINLHWVADFLDYMSFFQHNQKPLVWTLHDMNPFSGGEHYTERFMGMDEQGFPIQRTLSKEEISWHHQVMHQKRKIFEQVNNLHIVAPSQWLLQASKHSELFGKYPHDHIPYGLPMEIFKPRNQLFSRELLGLPKDKIILLFVSHSIGKARKGYAFLKKALETLGNKDIVLCAIGEKSGLPVQSGQVIELGNIQDKRMLSVAYSAADVFIIPSLEDNLPNTVLEALACGTPVIGFPVGGIPDMVQEGYNGLICPEISAPSLSGTLEKFLAHKNSFDRAAIRTDAVNRYDLKVQALAYKKLYKRILSEGS